MSKIPVKFWIGTRAEYNALGSNNAIDKVTRYVVSEPDGRKVEYMGTTPITEVSGQLRPVLSVVDTLPATLNVGDRYLVGHDASSEGDDAVYYVVEIASDNTLSSVNPISDFSVRVVDRGYKSYQVVNGKLTTYDGVIDCGTF